MRRQGRTGNRMDENLFGVERGLLRGIALTCSWDDEACNQVLQVTFRWQNRKPSDIYIYAPDDGQIAHYVAIWMPVVMHAQWQGKARLQGMILAAIKRSEMDATEIKRKGTPLVKR